MEEPSFAEILSQFEAEHAEPRARRGERKPARQGTVAGIVGDSVLVAFGAKSEGVIPAADLRDAQGNLTVKPGDTFDVTITGRNADGLVTLSRLKGPRPRDWEDLQAAFASQTIIAGRVTGLTKGGLTVDVGARAFLPASRSGVRDAAEMEKLVGQEIRCRMVQCDPEDENVVVDRRGVIEEEARLARENTLATLHEGDVVRGTVRNLMDFGAFLDLGGVDGLLHVSDMSWSKIGDPRSEFKVGDILDVKVLKIDRQNNKISLGLKQMYPDPWEEAVRELQPGERLRGVVTRLTDFGAFVEVRPGVEGLIHVSEMSWTKRVKSPSDILKKGEFVEAVVLKVDGPGRRLGLGLKQTFGNPWDTIAERYPAGKVVEGKVTRLATFGAFVEVEEGIEGMIHVSEFTHERRVEHPSEMVKIGATVRAVVLAADSENKRLKLGMKQLEATTADEFLTEHKAGDRVSGRVVKIAGRQATIQLGEGVEGTCAVAESAAAVSGTMAAALAAAWKSGPAAAPTGPEPLQEGQLRTFTILTMDVKSRRIELAVA